MSLKQLGKLLIKYGGPTVRQGLDTVTNPKTYQGLAKNVDDVLQRRIPQSGVNIQNAPMSLLGKVNDIFDMAPGRAKEEARNQLQRGFRMADRLSKGAPAPRGGLSSTGALRAPGVGPQVPRRPGLSPVSTTPARPSFNAQDFRDIGGPQLRSSLRPRPSRGRVPSGFASPPNTSGLSRTSLQTGNKLAGNSSMLRRLPKLGTASTIGFGLLDVKGELDAGRSPVDAFGRVVLGTGGAVLGGGVGGLFGITTGPGAVATTLAGGAAGYEAGAGLYDYLKGEMFPDVPADIVAIRERRLAKEGKTKRPSGMYGSIPPSVNTNLGAYDSSVTLPGMYGSIPTSVNTNLGAYDPSVTLPGRRNNSVEESVTDTILPPSNNLPSSPEAVVANPLQQKMAEYEQGRAKATTQEEMDAVRDLGMSIHQAANPQMYEESYNPLMAATFPERYQKTPEDFIIQGGIQAPRSMTEKDATQATAFGNKVQNIQGLDANPMYNPFEAAEEQSRSR